MEYTLFVPELHNNKQLGGTLDIRPEITGSQDHLATYLSSWILIEDTEYGQFSGQCFTRSSGCTKQHVMIRVVHSVKYLRLNWIEMSEPVREIQVVL